MSDKTERLLDQVKGPLWLTDGGLETVMVFLEGLDLPQFASFTLFDSAEGRAALHRYYTGFLDESAAQRAGFILDTATWRASAGWGQVMGLSADQIDAVNVAAVDMVRQLRADRIGHGSPILVNGVVGPHSDAYAPQSVLTPAQAQAYHNRQVAVLAAAGVDLVSAVTISSTGEAIGITRAAQACDIPVAVSFTLETDGRLISGMSLQEAVEQTDDATGGAPAWYGINCAHPDHFRHILTGDWVGRLGAIRANASRLSHAELDEASVLDDGDVAGLAEDYYQMLVHLPGLRVVGGCCGTDLRHVTAIGHRCRHQSQHG